MQGQFENKMVDPVNSTLGKMLLDGITPIVMVLRTPLVEESCLKNGLSFVQMLSPFSIFNNIDVPVRTASDQPYRLQKFNLRLFYASDVVRPNLEAAKERLKQVITQAGEKDFPELSMNPPQIENLLTSSASEILPSWFRFFNKELVQSVSFSDHEAFDHPVTCLLVVSSKDEQPINKFIDLFNTNQLPSLLNDGAMDPKILKHYLLVHDNQGGASENATKFLTEMRSTFGSNDCHLLCINSCQDGSVEHQINPWDTYENSNSASQPLGCFLTADDLMEVKTFMQDLSSKHIIPYMEQKIRDLNQQVSATRKGFRNQIKSLWWRKGKEDTQDAPNGPMYTFSSIESQIRVLGDYAFMLRDYELALSNYRLLSTDYKIDKAWMRYAGVQEMMGLTYFMLDQSRKEAESCMENAFNTYLKIGMTGKQNAIRCGLWWVDMLKTRHQYKEAANVYFRIPGEEPLHSAVMLEQASYCYLFSKPSMLHKYGFHLVLAGDRYKICDQAIHAARLYRNALSIYRGTTWSHIKDHVHFQIGRLYVFLGLFDLAINHMLEILACSHQSKATQELFIRDFLQIVQRTGKTFEVFRLQLPLINIPSLMVVFEDHRTYASPEAASVRESLWRSLEEDIIPSLPSIRTNWLEAQPQIASKKLKELNVCVAGEPVRVNIQFKNPLQIPLSISDVSLICDLSPRPDEAEYNANSSTNELHNEEEFRKLATCSRGLSSDTSSFTLSEVQFSLQGGEMLVVQLAVTPKVEGILEIVGIRWKLSGSVTGFHNFYTDLAKKKVMKGRRKVRRSPSNSMKFLVIASLPKLDGSILHLPDQLYAGDLRHVFLKLSNQSEFPVKNVKLKISHPRFLTVAKRETLDMEFPACLEKRSSDRSDMQGDSNKVSHNGFLFPEGTLIQGETPFLWPLWLRAAIPGKISLYISIYYEIGDISTSMRYRTLRMHYKLEVLPSLDVSFHINPCPSRLQEFLVRMDVVNKTISEAFRVNQLCCIGPQWEISLLEPVDNFLPSLFLVAGQAMSCFFKLSKGKTSSTSGGSNARLGSEESNDSLVDMYSSPLADFHVYERLQQGLSHQGHLNTVDFVLISHPQNSNINPRQPELPNIYSHHACYCSLASTSPIWYLMNGPRTVHHNFSTSFCEIKLSMAVHNSSDSLVSVHIDTSNLIPIKNQLSDTPTVQTSIASENQAGWYDISLVKDTRVTSDVLESQVAKSLSLESVLPFSWSGLTSTRIKVEPMCTIEVPLEICVFSPGIYDISNYILRWDLLNSEDEKENCQSEARQTSGTCSGHPFYLSVLQSTL